MFRLPMLRGSAPSLVGAALAVALTLPAPAAAALARWVPELPPTISRGAQYVFDSHRQRVLVISNNLIWAVTCDPTPQWSVVYRGTNEGSVVYDPTLDRLWAFTMASGGGYYIPGRLFSMDLAAPSPTWTERTYTSTTRDHRAPWKIAEFAAVFDPVRHRVVLWGGYFGNLVGLNTEVYTLDLNGTPTWGEFIFSGTQPAGRRIPTAIYDPIRDRMVVYGGMDMFGNNAFDETWALSLSTMTWQFLTPTTAVAWQRYSHSMLYDALHQRALVLGGIGPGGQVPPGPFRYYNDVWALSLSVSIPANSATWIRLPDSQGTRDWPLIWIDSSHDRLVRLGGRTTSGENRYDSWALSLSPAGWSAISVDSVKAPARVGHVAFGGGAPASWFTALGNPSSVWGRLLPEESPWIPMPGGGPGIRYWAGAVFDDQESRAIVFGGSSSATSNATGTEYADLWLFDPATPAWQPLAPPSTPTTRADALVVWDTGRRRILVHGGRATIGGKTRPRTDTWSYDAASNTWSTLAAGSFGGRWLEAGIYDPVRDRIVAFGGCDTLVNYNDVHILSLNPPGTWSTLATSGAPPTIVTPASVRAAYDPMGDRMIVLASDNNLLNAYALTLGASPTWSSLALDGPSPPRRSGYAFAANPGLGRLLVAQGEEYSGPTQDTWVLYLDETTPALASLVGTVTTPQAVHITWQLSPGIAAAEVDRRRDGSGWQTLGTFIADGVGRVEVHDFGVEPGRTYDYRIRQAGSPESLGETRVTIPMLPTLSLAGALPNPASGQIRVRFELATSAPAEIEMFDVLGHRVLRREFRDLGPGAHTVDLLSGLPPGLYFLQLSQSGVTRRARVAVIR